MAPIIGSVCEQRIAKDREDLLMEKRSKIALSSPNRKQGPYTSGVPKFTILHIETLVSRAAKETKKAQCKPTKLGQESEQRMFIGFLPTPHR
uniref:Uncharacterized protein n=1 Tax=Timema shepardi TaxID=629360 RepID=A0A7R9G2P1_TIMSH|nr:unnamed protein product [Timema shepardi]